MLRRIYSEHKLVTKFLLDSIPPRSVYIDQVLLRSFNPTKCHCRFSTKINTTSKCKSSSLEFSGEEKTKILQVLNDDSDECLKRLNIPSMQIKRFKMWRSKNGPFNSVVDALDIDGIDVKSLIKLCQSIILDKPISSSRKVNAFKNRQLISPLLASDIVESLSSAVGMHLGPAGISWAHISYPGKKLNHWGSKKFSDLPMKVTSWENFDLAMEVLNEIPPADLYVFEAPPGLGLQPQNQLGALVSYTQHIELTSMLLALLNTSEKHNKRIAPEKKVIGNIVYFLKAKLAARLFQTWVGTESVSTITTVKQMFNFNEFTLPCSPILIDQHLMTTFERQSSSNKELLGQSLLLTVAFLDLCVNKNPLSLKALTSSRIK